MAVHERSVEVDAPVHEVFLMWRNWSNFPKFMSHVKDVKDLGGGKSHWSANIAGIDAGQPLPLPGTEGYEALPQFPKRSALPFRRTIRRQELRLIVPLAETTIYEMERRGEFPRRFNLTPRCVVWDLAEVEAWVEERKQAPRGGVSKPDVHLRKTRPVRAGSSEE